MKTSFAIRVSALAAVIVALLSPARTVEAAEHNNMKGAERLLMLNKIETKAQADALTPDDSFAMVCSKCKTVYVTRVKQGTKGAQLLMEGGQPKELIGTHACSGCKSTIEVTGHGKDKDMHLKHSCKACGDESAFCCATKPGAAPTHDMKKK